MLEEEEDEKNKRFLDLTALGALTSIRRILDLIHNDVPLLCQLEKIIFPCLMHSISTEDMIVEGIYIITLILFDGYKDKPLISELW